MGTPVGCQLSRALAKPKWVMRLVALLSGFICVYFLFQLKNYNVGKVSDK